MPSTNEQLARLREGNVHIHSDTRNGDTLSSGSWRREVAAAQETRQGAVWGRRV